jgi:peptidoglycan/LPS O-acetylase OafA/YrhL
MVLLPDELSNYAKSYISSFGIFSNFYFWHTTGYFNPSVDFLPLIHIWSLSVEEQFYFFFPLLVIVLFSFDKFQTRILFFLFALSLSLYLSLANQFPVATFYLLPFRIWEFVFGSLIAILLEKKSLISNIKKGFLELFSILTISTIILISIFYDRSSIGSQYIQTIVVLASGVFLILIQNTLIINQILNNRILQRIGLASYSIYLVHQPILALWRQVEIGELSNNKKLLCLLITFLLAFGIFKWVETPLRIEYQNNHQNLILIRGFSISVIISIIVAMALTSSFGTLKKYSAEQEKTLSFKSPVNQPNYEYGKCFLGAGNPISDFKSDCLTENSHGNGTLLIGDSHAAMISIGLKSRIEGFSTLTYTGCFALTQSKILPSHCHAVFQYDLKVIAKLKPRNILIAGNWLDGSFRTKFGEQTLLASLAQTVTLINKRSPHSEIFIVGNTPQWSPNLPSQLVRQNISLNQREKIFTPDYAELRALDLKIKSVIFGSHIHFIDTLSSLCTPQGLCQSSGDYLGQSEPFVFDNAHTTNFGSNLLGEIIAKQLLDR